MTKNSGIEVFSIHELAAFWSRKPRERDLSQHLAELCRMAEAILAAPDQALEALTDSAITLCGADSAGISVERREDDGRKLIHWRATSGRYKRFQGAVLSSGKNVSEICLERNTAQLFRASMAFFKHEQAEAEPVTDALMIPWHATGSRGTFWVLAHGRTEAFDGSDLDTLAMLSRMAAGASNYQHKKRVDQRSWAAMTAQALTDALAQRIKEPVRTLQTLIEEAARSEGREDSRMLATYLSEPLQSLVSVVADFSVGVIGGRPN